MDEQPDDEHREPPIIDALTSEPPVFGTPRASNLSLTGADAAWGDIARGLGAHRMKVAVFGVGGTLLVLALVAAIR